MSHEHVCMIEHCGKSFPCSCPNAASVYDEAILNGWEVYCEDHREAHG